MIFNPQSCDPFQLSRNKIELFFECPRCFYDSVRREHSRPSTPGFVVNNAIDELVKSRFDFFRELQQPDPLMTGAGIPGVPFKHHDLKMWRDWRTGLRFVDPKTNFQVMGALDDVWDTQGEGLCVLDTKAGDDAKDALVGSHYWDCYKRQMDIYSWLLEQSGHKVNPMSYFLWAQAVCKKRGDGDEILLRLHSNKLLVSFKLSVVPYRVSTGWIGDKLVQIRECLTSDKAPRPSRGCKYCRFRRRIRS